MVKQKNDRNLKFRDGKWYVDFTYRGKRIREFGGYTKEQARNTLAKLRIDRLNQKLGFDRPCDPVFEIYIETFLKQRQIRRPATAVCYRRYLGSILKSDLFKGRKLSEITAANVSKYHAERGAVAMVSANRELTFLKMIFKQAVIEGATSVNPALGVKRYTEQKNKLRILDDDEAARLLHMANPQLAPILKILLTTAMRPHEVFALRWEYPGWDKEKALPAPIVSLKQNLIYIPGTVAKNHKDRELDLSPELRAMFETLPRAESGEVFPYNSMPKSFRAAVNNAKLKNVTLYTLKHTAASRMIRAGIDLVTVSELIGHADVNTTMIYCHANRETKREAVARMSRIYLAPAAEPPAVEAENEQTLAGH